MEDNGSKNPMFLLQKHLVFYKLPNPDSIHEHLHFMDVYFTCSVIFTCNNVYNKCIRTFQHFSILYLLNIYI